MLTPEQRGEIVQDLRRIQAEQVKRMSVTELKEIISQQLSYYEQDEDAHRSFVLAKVDLTKHPSEEVDRDKIILILGTEPR
jgi:hypothetical protein